jgi:uroporphyrinogen-III synthase
MERAAELGIDVIACPLFRVESLPWEAPDAAQYDGLLLTSANAVRHAAVQLTELATLPVHAVGAATAKAARNAGLHVETCGSSNVDQLMASLPLSLRLLHLAGEDHRPNADARIDRRIVYRAALVADPGLPQLDGLVVAVHSPRAGARLAELAEGRDHAILAAISSQAAMASGPGWERVAISPEPNDKSLLALAASLCHTTGQ